MKTELLNLAKCSSCPLFCNRIVPSEGPLSPDIMIIGESPGDIEHYQQVPFVGDGGKLLRHVLTELMKESDVQEQTIYYTNTVLCRPPDNRKVTENEIAHCFNRLSAEIETLQPKKILLLGSIATKTILGEKKLTNIRGKITDYNGIPTMVTFHPNFILMNQNMYQTFTDDIYHLIQDKDLHEQKTNHWLQPRVYEYVTDSGRGKEILQSIIDGYVVLDIETFGLDEYRGEIFYVGIRHKGKSYIYPHSVFSECKEYWPDVVVVAHEARMEYQWFWVHYGIRLDKIEDTLVLAHLLDERTGKGISKSLKTLAQTRLGVHDWAAETKAHIACLIDFPDQSRVWEYLCYDIDVTDALYLDLLGELDQYPGMKSYWESTSRPSIPFFNRLTAHGIRVDLDYLESVGEELEIEIKKHKQIMIEASGKENFNPASNVMLPDLLYNQWGWPQLGKENSTGEGILNDLLAHFIDSNGFDSPEELFINALLKFRELSKLYSTYIVGLDKATSPDGRIHSKFLLEGTTTGRLSSKDPNLHNIPRPGTTIIDVRKAFIPDKEMYIYDADYSQLELRVGAHMANDRNLIELINSGVDMHKRMAGFILGISEEDVTEKQRQFAKNMLFAIMFDADERSLVYTFRRDFPFLTRELAHDAIMFLRSEFPDLYLNAVRLKRFALKNNYTETLFGNRRWFLLQMRENKKAIMRAATNMTIQGTSSIICMKSGQRIEKEHDYLKIHMLIHDGIIHSGPKDYDTDPIKKIMGEMPFKTDVKFNVKIKSGERWGGQ